MSYVVLARKYRPRSFSEVAGQEVVTRTLRGAIEEGRVGHAYLFHGPRGTGKTTSARLFAKALNCAEGPAPEPCGTCERCQAFDAGAEADLLEIDAASNTGVDHVRDLRDQAGYVPLRARFKIFLVDEVHMLSKAAFNALLKTLEEPPPHVKFLFATTELHKVPDTIVSRCQVLRLSPLPEATITKQLDRVFELEGIQAEPGVTGAIAARARGGMRDALSMADQLLAAVGSSPTLADCSRLAGDGAAARIERIVDALLDCDRKGVLEALPEEEGGESELLGALLDHVRTALVLGLCGEDAPMVAARWSPEQRAAWRARAGRAGAARLEVWLQELLHARERMGPVHMHALARAVLEATLLDLCRPEGDLDLAQIAERLAALEDRLVEGGATPRVQDAGARRAPEPRAGSTASEPRPAPRATQAAPPPERLDPVARGAEPPPVAERRATAATEPALPETPAAGPAGARASEPGERDPKAAGPADAALRDVDVPRAPAAPAQAAPGAAGADPSVSGGATRPAARRGPGPAARPRVTTNSTADAWKAFLEELSGRAGALGDVLGRRGQLVHLGEATASVKLDGLREDERALVSDRRNQRLVSKVFAEVVGRGIDVQVEDHSAPGAAANDAFASEVAKLFDGRIER